MAASAALQQGEEWAACACTVSYWLQLPRARLRVCRGKVINSTTHCLTLTLPTVPDTRTATRRTRWLPLCWSTLSAAQHSTAAISSTAQLRSTATMTTSTSPLGHALTAMSHSHTPASHHPSTLTNPPTAAVTIPAGLSLIATITRVPHCRCLAPSSASFNQTSIVSPTNQSFHLAAIPLFGGGRPHG